jgi:hypothetical protein
MPLSIPRPLIEFILLGPEDDRRQIQDSPILADVWVEYAKSPDEKLALLITPYREHAAGKLANVLDAAGLTDADLAYLQGIVIANLTFEELLRFVVPLTSWWTQKGAAAVVDSLRSPASDAKAQIAALLESANLWLKKAAQPPQPIPTSMRYLTVAGLILWAKKQPAINRWDLLSADRQMTRILRAEDLAQAVVDALAEIREKTNTPTETGLIWTVSLNRRATPAITKSVGAVKADAARTLFRVDCKDIVWAVIDSGIDASHPVFRDTNGKTRVRKSFDFTIIRDVVNLENLRNESRRRRLVEEIVANDPPNSSDRTGEVEKDLLELAADAKAGRPINWEIVERLVAIPPESAAPHPHGTHVAGILGAAKTDKVPESADGMCPEISIYDFRVLPRSDLPAEVARRRQAEFAIIAALQFIRRLNERSGYMIVHGANLSLSIPHDVRNYACGWTPVCVECERLVNSGVVVVAAAGNRGYQNFETANGRFEGYAAFSVTDPGNADGVITVGATHRFWPHTYGVSFFSSRGPTGDGRLKPDLVAPGERIGAPLPGGNWGDLDGTSMAAPHVSGAAAMLMARYSELIGQPRRIKKILCDSATNLGRERTFQGHGMLDVLRAFQSI